MKLTQLGGEDSTRWEVIVYLGRDSTGKYRRARRRFEAKGRVAARKHGQAIERRLQDVDISAHRTSFTGAVEAWWPLHSPTLEDSTRAEYRRLIDKVVLKSPHLCKPLVQVTRADVRRFYQQLVTDGRAGSGPQVRTIIKGALQLALDDGLLSDNPAKGVAIPKVESPEYPKMRLAEIHAVVDAATARDPLRGRALQFAALTGLRRGELVGLRWSRVSFEDGTVTGDKAIAVGPPPAGGGARPLVEKGTKSGTKRVIDLDEETADLLHDQLEWQQAAAAELGRRRADDGYVWCTTPPFTEPTHPNTVTKWFERAVIDSGVDKARAAAGLPRPRLHDLRHWHASVMAGNVDSVAGASLADVQRRLGHRQLATTLRYVHADEEETRIGRQLARMQPSLRRRDQPSLSPAVDDLLDTIEAEVIEDDE